MSLLTIAWSFSAAVCVMLGSIHLLFWFRNRSLHVYLLSSLMAVSAGVSAMLELGLLLTESLDTYRLLILWENVAIFMILVPMVWFVQTYFGTGRRWLAITITLLWTLGILANFLSPHSLTFIEVSELKRLATAWGEDFTVPLGTENPWKLLADIASLLILVYVGDATVRLWRQGGQRTALVIGGGIVFFILLAGIHTPLVDAGVIATPYMINFAFLAIIISLTNFTGNIFAFGLIFLATTSASIGVLNSLSMLNSSQVHIFMKNCITKLVQLILCGFNIWI